MKIKIIQIRSFLFYLAYFSFLAFSTIGHIAFLFTPLKLLSNLSIGFLGLSTLLSFKDYKNKDLLYIFLLVILSIVLVYKTNDYTFLKLMLFIVSFKDMNFEKVIKVDLYYRGFLIALVFILFFVGIAPDKIFAFGDTIRHSFGFTNPNTLGMYFLIICFDLLYLNKDKNSLKKTMLISGIIILVNYLSGSRTVTLILLILIIFIWIIRKKEQVFEIHFLKAFITNSALIFAILTFIFSYLYKYENDMAINLNNLLSNRLENILYCSANIVPSLFGSNISILERTLDSSYAYSLYGYGIILSIVLILMFRKLFKVLYKEKDYLLITIMFLFLVYGLSERLWLCIDYNIFMLVFYKVLYSKIN